jgi:hypothetical protein
VPASSTRSATEVLEEIMTEGVRACWSPTLQRFSQAPETLRHRVKMFVAGLRGHLQPLHLQQDDERELRDARAAARRRRPLATVSVDCVSPVALWSGIADGEHGGGIEPGGNRFGRAATGGKIRNRFDQRAKPGGQ